MNPMRASVGPSGSGVQALQIMRSKAVFQP